MRLFEKLKDLVGKPYVLGGHSVEEGLDCFGFVYCYLERMGIELPTEFEGVSIDKYHEFYLRDPEGAKEVMVRFVDSVLERGDEKSMIAGDVLLLETRGRTFLGVYGGNSNVLVAAENYGVVSAPVDLFKIKRVWRCRRCQQLSL